MAQTKTIQLLRSSAAYADFATAKSTLETMSGRKDGELVLARYWQDNEIKSLLGIYHAAPDLTGKGITQNSTKGWTFIQDQSTVDAILDGLDANTNVTKTGSGSGATYAATDSSMVIVGVMQEDGQVTSVSAAIKDVVLTGYQEGTDTDIAATDTLGQALGKLQAQINAMDLTKVGGTDGDVIVAISEADGKVSATKSSLTDVEMTGYSKTSDTGAIAATDTLEQAFNKVENAIAAGNVHSNDQSITVAADETDGGTNIEVNVDSTTIVKDGTSHAIKGNYTLHALNSTELAALNDNNVKEAYQLQTIGGSTAIGDVVKIYKDSALQEVYLGASTDTINASTGVITKNTVDDPQSMNFAYQLADGTYSLTKIDVSKFLTQSEFGDGLSVSNAGVVSVKVGNGLEIDGTSKAVNVKIDSTSENFLTVGANGVKLSGVQSAINTAIEGLNVTDTAVAGQYVSAVSETDGEISVSRANVADAVLTGYSKGSSAPASTEVAATDDVKTAFAKLEWQIDAATTAAVENLDAEVTSSDGTNVQVKVTEVDGIITAVNVTDNSINATDLQTAIAALDADLDASGTAQRNGTFVMSGVTEVDGVLTAVDSVEVEAAGAAAAAKTTIDAYTVNNKAISTNPVLNGADIALTGYSKGSDATAVSANDTVNAAVGKLENQIANVKTTADGALQSVSSGNGAIAVGSEDANHDQSISLVLNSGSNEMLTIENGGLNLSTSWDCGTF